MIRYGEGREKREGSKREGGVMRKGLKGKRDGSDVEG